MDGWRVAGGTKQTKNEMFYMFYDYDLVQVRTHTLARACVGKSQTLSKLVSVERLKFQMHNLFVSSFFLEF